MTGSSISAPVQTRGYPRAAVDYDAPQRGIKEPCVSLREGSLVEAILDAQRPPGLALLTSDYKERLCSEPAVVSGWMGPLDQRPANDAQ